MNSLAVPQYKKSILFMLTVLSAMQLMADDTQQTRNANKVASAKNDPGPSKSPFNLAWKTTGGMQFWTDHLFRDGYRIQQNAITGHWRLLNSDNVRLGWGSRETCESVLDRKSPIKGEATHSQSTVILLHGLMRTRSSMSSLEKVLVENDFPNVIRFSYASTRKSILDHAKALQEVIENLPPKDEFRFVGHSMGNIVVRNMISNLEKSDPKNVLARCKSMVMLGPPNQGAMIAKRLAPTGVFGWVTGAGGLELGPDWEKLEKNLATPSFPFAIVAGDISAQPIQNPLTDGSGDFVVSVEEAKLDGAKWLKTVPVLHSFLMDDPAVQNLTIEFLTTY
ncbi:alpha/beta hydrolase [Rubripirellula sp.]|jgi:pimeloyl-ACP methyl ester carboxylesterase|nr:alpha/beta hydrolase [Rubripirellula sp.]